MHQSRIMLYVYMYMYLCCENENKCCSPHQTYKDEGSEALLYDVHFWIGKYSTQVGVTFNVIRSYSCISLMFITIYSLYFLFAIFFTFKPSNGASNYVKKIAFICWLTSLFHSLVDYIIVISSLVVRSNILYICIHAIQLFISYKLE